VRAHLSATLLININICRDNIGITFIAKDIKDKEVRIEVSVTQLCIEAELSFSRVVLYLKVHLRNFSLNIHTARRRVPHLAFSGS
jgi:hypothetical protein